MAALDSGAGAGRLYNVASINRSAKAGFPLMSRGRNRVMKRRAINGEFLDCVSYYPSDRGRDCALLLSTRRQYSTLVEIIGFDDGKCDMESLCDASIDRR